MLFACLVKVCLYSVNAHSLPLTPCEDHPMAPTILLASTSPYRAELLRKLGLDFEQQAPVCDETPQLGETPRQLVERLARNKAESLSDKSDTSVVIGSDQVADLHGRIIGKPGSHEAATEQLASVSGQRVTFYTGLSILRGSNQSSCVVTTEVQFRTLNAGQIERYLLADTPYQCACSFKSESLGTAIVKSMTSEDPSALIGLPLIKLVELLDGHGVYVP